MALELMGRDVASTKALNKVRPGVQFGQWTVLSVEAKRRARALCHCQCGTERLVNAGDLISGKSKSCGCTKSAAISAAKTTHGGSESAEYRIWAGMKRRCSKPLAAHYDRYGGRGIKVCQRWSDSFEAFLADMGPRPAGMSIDRYPNRDGNYEPGNCRWADAFTQANNRTDNRYATLDGRTQTVGQWARELGIRTRSVKRRAARLGVLHPPTAKVEQITDTQYHLERKAS